VLIVYLRRRRRKRKKHKDVRNDDVADYFTGLVSWVKV
jgi:hypothetical protein